MSSESAAETIAAVDLGSNSFHLLVARLVDGTPMPVDRLRERVALAEGLDQDGNISDEAQARAIECLERFGQRLRDVSKSNIRAVGTNTLRRASRPRKFVTRMEAALGHSIDVIDGSEEARLIYMGVANDLADDTDRRLVIDIGGGSTEFIIGERNKPLRMHSLPMGCVAFSERFFESGVIDAQSFARATSAARLELRPYKRKLRELGWEDCIGSSGTNNAVERVLRALGRARDGITHEDLCFLRDELLQRGTSNKLDSLEGLSEDRRSVFAPGVAILISAFECLHIKCMRTSRSALREGVLRDLIGRLHHEDVRDDSVDNLAQKYHCDEGQSTRVRKTAKLLFKAARKPWQLADDELQLLEWACTLHEIGLAISLRKHHHHSAYLAENSVMPGFSRSSQEALGFLLRSQRGKPVRDAWDLESASQRHIAVLLRLAVRLNRGRSTGDLDLRSAEFSSDQAFLVFEPGWIERHPMTRADLEKEVRHLESAGYALSITEAPQ